jgi:hypothetical protein
VTVSHFPPTANRYSEHTALRKYYLPVRVHGFSTIRIDTRIGNPYTRIGTNTRIRIRVRVYGLPIRVYGLFAYWYQHIVYRVHATLDTTLFLDATDGSLLRRVPPRLMQMSGHRFCTGPA